MNRTMLLATGRYFATCVVDEQWAAADDGMYVCPWCSGEAGYETHEGTCSVLKAQKFLKDTEKEATP